MMAINEALEIDALIIKTALNPVLHVAVQYNTQADQLPVEHLVT